MQCGDRLFVGTARCEARKLSIGMMHSLIRASSKNNGDNTMGNVTTIGWTDKTHNEWIGCQKVTEEECGDCYAWRWAVRHHMDVWGSLSGSNRHLTKTHENPRKWNQEAKAQGKRIKVFC